MAFTIKVRGALAGPVCAEYRCEECGVFEATVERDDRGDAAAEAPCPACGELAPWTPSALGVHTKYAISVSRGPNDAKPSRYAMDTRSLGEGQSHSDWRRDRRKLWEEKRKERVMRLKAEGPDPS